MFGGSEGKDVLPLIQARVENGEAIAEEDVEPEINIATQAIIRMYNGIAEWRTAGGFGPNPLSLSDIMSYCTFTGLVLNSFELECIKLIDSAFLANYKTGK